MENLQPPALLSIIRELPMPCHVDLGEGLSYFGM